MICGTCTITSGANGIPIGAHFLIFGAFVFIFGVYVFIFSAYVLIFGAYVFLVFASEVNITLRSLWLVHQTPAILYYPPRGAQA